MAQTTASPGTRYLRFVERAAYSYAILAAALAALMTYLIFGSLLSGGGSAVTLPVGANPATLATTLGSDDAHFTMVEFTGIGLSPAASLFYFAPRLLVPLTHVIVAIAIARFAAGARAERPFGDNLSRSITVIAWSVAILGTLSQLFFSYGTSIASHELLRGTGLGTGWTASPPFDWTPVLVGLALLAVVVVLRSAERMQRDTDGLI
jgi:hypothetical protein